MCLQKIIGKLPTRTLHTVLTCSSVGGTPPNTKSTQSMDPYLEEILVALPGLGTLHHSTQITLRNTVNYCNFVR